MAVKKAEDKRHMLNRSPTIITPRNYDLGEDSGESAVILYIRFDSCCNRRVKTKGNGKIENNSILASQRTEY